MQSIQVPEWVAEINDSKEREIWMQYYSLPKRLQDILFDEKIAETMWTISYSKYRLSDRQISEVSYLTGQVVQGKLSLNNFIPELMKIIEEKEKARAIAQDINEQIFQPVREELLEVHGIQAGGDVAQESHVGAAPPEAQTMTTEQPERRAEPSEEQRAPAMPEQNDASQKREELLARLKAAQDATIAAPAPQTPPQEPEPPKPVTAAWNGKTIDLTKIPPRRQLNGNGKKNGEEEIKTVQLKKGPDGYWYEI